MEQETDTDPAMEKDPEAVEVSGPFPCRRFFFLFFGSLVGVGLGITAWCILPTFLPVKEHGGHHAKRVMLAPDPAWPVDGRRVMNLARHTVEDGYLDDDEVIVDCRVPDERNLAFVLRSAGRDGRRRERLVPWFRFENDDGELYWDVPKAARLRVLEGCGVRDDDPRVAYVSYPFEAVDDQGAIELGIGDIGSDDGVFVIRRQHGSWCYREILNDGKGVAWPLPILRDAATGELWLFIWVPCDGVVTFSSDNRGETWQSRGMVRVDHGPVGHPVMWRESGHLYLRLGNYEGDPFDFRWQPGYGWRFVGIGRDDPPKAGRSERPRPKRDERVRSGSAAPSRRQPASHTMGNPFPDHPSDIGS